MCTVTVRIPGRPKLARAEAPGNTPNASIDDCAGVVNYTIDAVTGPQYHLGLLKFDNVSDSSLRGLLMRGRQMMPRAPPSTKATSPTSSSSLGTRSSCTLVRVKATYDAHAVPDTHEVDVAIRQ
jgi:hypothetical protein